MRSKDIEHEPKKVITGYEWVWRGFKGVYECHKSSTVAHLRLEATSGPHREGVWVRVDGLTCVEFFARGYFFLRWEVVWGVGSPFVLPFHGFVGVKRWCWANAF